MASVASLSAIAAPVNRLAAARRVAVAGGNVTPVVIRSSGLRVPRVAKVSAYQEAKQSEPADELTVKATEFFDKAKAKWDETEEKPAVVAITAVSFVAIWAASALVDGIEKLPLIGPFFEFVGLIVTSWFVYRYLLFGPDREELKKNIDGFLAKVSGKAESTMPTPPKVPKAETPNGATATEKALP